MANEISLNISASIAHGSVRDTIGAGVKQITQAGTKIYVDVMSLTDSYASAAKGSVGSLGLIFITALSTNVGTVIVTPDGGTTSFLTLAAGVTACLPMTPGFTIANLQLKMSASTGGAVVSIWEA